MYVWILDQAGEIGVHRTLKASPDALLKVIAPSRDDLVIAVECLFTWYGRADCWAQEDIPFVLGHALAMTAIHGAKAQNDTIDAHKIAILLRGGMLPQAYVYPAAMRATRDLLRRRLSLMRKRAELLPHVQQTNHQSHRPEIGNKIASQATRDGVAERFPAPAVQKSIAVDLALSGYDDNRVRDLALHLVTAAKQDSAKALYRLRTLPGIGKIRSLVLLDESHDIRRFIRGQEFVSYCRLVKCANESAGKRDGVSGTKIGNAYLKWAFSEAAVRFLQHHPVGQQLLARLAKKHAKGNALTVMAHQLARAVYDMFKRETAFDRDKFLQE